VEKKDKMMIMTGRGGSPIRSHGDRLEQLKKLLDDNPEIMVATGKFMCDVPGGEDGDTAIFVYSILRGGGVVTSYVADIPDDIEDPEERSNLAQMEMDATVPEYMHPAAWVVDEDNGQQVMVTRYSRYVKPG
jgi:hypothetical protein